MSNDPVPDNADPEREADSDPVVQYRGSGVDPNTGHDEQSERGPDFDPVVQYRGTEVDVNAAKEANTDAHDPDFDPVVQYRGTELDIHPEIDVPDEDA
jgi:hypothetical protein